PLPETGYTMWPSLRPQFWIPVFENAGPTGRFGGALTAGTDALGRFAYATDLFVSPEPFRAEGDFALVCSALGNPTLDVSAWASWTDLGRPPSAPTVTVSELDHYAALGASFVTLRWRSLGSLRVAAELERARYAAIPDTSLAAVCPGCVTQNLVGGSVTLTLSRLVTGALSVSPENGVAWSVTYRRREEQGGARWSNELRSRLALYARVPGLGGFAHHVLALRLLVGGTNGPLGTLFRVGGVAPQGVNVFFAPTLNATRAFPLRGYASGELRGERAAAGSVEYRLPLALVGRAVGHLPVGVDRVWLNLFADAGDAWAPGASPRLTRLRSCGLDLSHTTPVAAVRDQQIDVSELDLVREQLKDEYEILEELGRGGMAIVFKAREKQLERDVAIKVLPFSLAFDKEFVERFQREARTSAKLEHPSIIPIYRVGKSGRVIYFVMKFLRGKPLSSVLAARGTLPPAEIRQILVQVARALAYAHKSGIVHRDIKPDNIMFDEHGLAVVTDFGIAKAASGGKLTGTGMSIGTPHYMSPEQARAQPLDGRSDIYSLGVVAYQSLTGRVPFDGEDSFSIGYKHIMEEIPTPPLETYDQRTVFEITRKMMAKSPDERFQSADDLVQALEAGGGFAAVGLATAATKAIPSLAGVRMASAATTPLPRVPDRPGAEEHHKR